MTSSRLLPRPFRPPSETCSLSPLIPPGPGTGPGSLEASGPAAPRESLETQIARRGTGILPMVRKPGHN